MRRFAIALAVTIAMVGGPRIVGCGKTMVDRPVVWLTDYDAALTIAKRQNKPLLVFVSASWDTAQKELKNNTFTDPRVRAVLNRSFITMNLDVTDDENDDVKAVARRLNLLGEPELIFFAPDGKTELARYHEYMDADHFLRILEVIVPGELSFQDDLTRSPGDAWDPRADRSGDRGMLVDRRLAIGRE